MEKIVIIVQFIKSIFFLLHELWSIMVKGYKDRIDATSFEALEQDAKAALLETKIQDQKALYHIFQAVEELVFMKISMVETSHATWDILQRSYKGDDRVKKIRLQTMCCEFESLSMDESKSISTYLDRVQAILNKKISTENI